MTNYKESLTAEDVGNILGLSQRSLQALETMISTLEIWQKHINLISPKSFINIWRRHVLDSAQLFPLIPGNARSVVDLGSGAGFPGIVLAILGLDRTPSLCVHLVESNAKKCAFLSEVARATTCTVRIHNERIEMMQPMTIDVITARACAPLGQLIYLAQPFSDPSTRCLFLKGRHFEQELTESLESWRMQFTCKPSITDPDGVVLILEKVVRRDAN